MLRNLKALGLAAIAALAMSAMFASGASAQAGTFYGGDTPETTTTTNLFGEQYGEPNAFTTSSSTVECAIAEFEGHSATGESTDMTITPHYTDCNADGLPATVTMNGCDYHFDQPVKSGEKWEGTVDLECEGTGVQLEIYALGGVTSHAFKVCTVYVEPFENLGSVTYTNATKENGDDDITVEVEVGEIPYEEMNQVCSPGEQSIPHTTKSALYESTVTMEGLEGDEIWIE